MASVPLEERVAALESELEQIKQRLSKDKSDEATPWWERHFGAFKGSPYYDEAMRLGADYRRSQPTPCDESEDDVSAGH